MLDILLHPEAGRDRPGITPELSETQDDGEIPDLLKPGDQSGDVAKQENHGTMLPPSHEKGRLHTIRPSTRHTLDWSKWRQYPNGPPRGRPRQQRREVSWVGS